MLESQDSRRGKTATLHASHQVLFYRLSVLLMSSVKVLHEPMPRKLLQLREKPQQEKLVIQYSDCCLFSAVVWMI